VEDSAWKVAGGVDVIEVKVNRQIYVYLPMMQGKAVARLNGIDDSFRR